MSEELKPCPFCGSPSATTQARHPSILPYFVECSTCDARGARREDREAAIAAWNIRVEDDSVTKKLLKVRIAQNMLLQNGNARLREHIAALEAENSTLRKRIEEENMELARQVMLHPWVRVGTTDWCAGCGAMKYTRERGAHPTSRIAPLCWLSVLCEVTHVTPKSKAPSYELRDKWPL